MKKIKSLFNLFCLKNKKAEKTKIYNFLWGGRLGLGATRLSFACLVIAGENAPRAFFKKKVKKRRMKKSRQETKTLSGFQKMGHRNFRYFFSLFLFFYPKSFCKKNNFFDENFSWPNFSFWPQFSWQNLKVFTNVSILGKNLNFWQKFEFVTKIWICDKNLNLWQKFEFVTKFWIFWQN